MLASEFKDSEWGAFYDLDMWICYTDRRINKNHMYDIFEDFSGTDGEEAKLTMLTEVGDNYDWYESRGRVVLNMQSRDLIGWLKYHLNNKTACADELSIYTLSHIYDRHTVILGRGQPWCTIRPTGDPKEADFPTLCQVHLLYIGKDIYAPLTPRAADIPPHVQECEEEIANIFARQPPPDYAAYYRELEYSDYVEVTSVKMGWSQRSHPHGPPSHTVSKAPELDQPIFPSPVILSTNQDADPIIAGTSSNITTHPATLSAEPVEPMSTPLITLHQLLTIKSIHLHLHQTLIMRTLNRMIQLKMMIVHHIAASTIN